MGRFAGRYWHNYRRWVYALALSTGIFYGDRPEGCRSSRHGRQGTYNSPANGCTNILDRDLSRYLSWVYAQVGGASYRQGEYGRYARADSRQDYHRGY